jgi:hypothetical protein
MLAILAHRAGHIMPFFGKIAKKASGATISPDSRLKAEVRLALAIHLPRIF